MARELNSALGYSGPDGHKFYSSENPRAKFAWSLAVMASEMLCGHEMDDALGSVLAQDGPPEHMARRLSEVEAQKEAALSRLGKAKEERRESEARIAKRERRIRALGSEIARRKRTLRDYPREN